MTMGSGHGLIGPGTEGTGSGMMEGGGCGIGTNKQPVRVHCPLMSLWDSERRLMVQMWRAFGANDQFDKTIEECAELVVALSHYRRCRDGNLRLERWKVIEEVVDTINMCHEILTILEVTGDEYNQMFAKKLQRLKDTYQAQLEQLKEAEDATKIDQRSRR